MAEARVRLRKEAEEEKTFIKGLGFCSFGMGSNVATGDVKNDTISRIRPLRYDWKYQPEAFDPWKIETLGQTFEPAMKSLLPSFNPVYKKPVYSANRILYRSKRVHRDHNGNGNPDNHGKSRFVRISSPFIVSEGSPNFGEDPIIADS